MWVVGIDKPYYPEIYFHNDYAEAKKKYDMLIEMFSENGSNKSTVFIAEVNQSIKVMTD